MITLNRICRVRTATLVFGCFCILLLPPTCVGQAGGSAVASQPTAAVQTLLDQAEQAAASNKNEGAEPLYRKALEVARAQKDIAGEARTRNKLGNYYYHTLHQPKQALPLYEMARQLYKQLGDRGREANMLFDLGLASADNEAPQKALEYYALALPIYESLGDKGSEADTWSARGNVYFFLGQSQIALDAYLQALPRYAKAQDAVGEASTRNRIGLAYTGIGKPQKALEFHNSALSLFRQLQNRSGEANALNQIGNTYADQGQSSRALEYDQQALAVQIEIHDLAGEANTRCAIGNIYLELKPQEALAYYQKALAIQQQNADVSGEGITRNSMGRFYYRIGKHEQALENYQRAMLLHGKAGNIRRQANTGMNIGLLYADIGEPQKASQAYQEALTLFQKAGDLSAEAITLNNLADVAADVGQVAQEFTYYQQALALFVQVGDSIGEALTRNNLGLAYTLTDQPQKALDYNQQALQNYLKAGNKIGEAQARRYLGLAYSGLGQPQKALSSYQEALARFQEAGVISEEADTLSDIAREQERQGHLTEAAQNYRTAIERYETVRENLGSLSEAKTSFLGTHLEVYHRYLNLLIEQGKSSDAFALAQKTKARALLDLLAGGKATIETALTPQERDQEHLLRHNAEELNAQIIRAATNSSDAQQQKQLTSQQQKAEQMLQRFTDGLYALHPQLAQQRVATTLTLSDLGPLLPADTAVLEYVVLKAGHGKEALDQVVLFVVTQEKNQPTLTTYPLATSSQMLADQARGFRLACAAQPGTAVQQPYANKARELYRLLLDPAAKQITGKKRLVICPDGPLWEVPFPALLLPARTPGTQSPFLLERYEVAYAYSASGMKAELDARSQTGRRQPTRTLLALANPDFGDMGRGNATPTSALPARSSRSPRKPLPLSHGVQEALLPLALTRGGLAPLQSTQLEADALRQDFPDATIKVGKAARKSVVLQEGGQYRYLHLASHGFFNDAAPLLSSIALAQPAPHDYTGVLLTAREFLDLTLSAEMVVLSACETGRGEQRSGEGIIGLTWAIFVAGAPTQVVSAWSVNDASTAQLMQQFYANLTQKHQTKGAALRGAALSLLHGNNSEYQHPYYWAPFFLVGDWR